MSHPLYTLLGAAIVAGAMNRQPRGAVRTFLWCIASVVAGGWAMYWLHG